MVKPPNPKYIPKLYEKILFPGQRVRIDVKFVTDACLVGEAKGKRFYQYTVIDKYSGFRYLGEFEKHNTYSSALLLEHLIKKFSFPIQRGQTDNDAEFTKRLLPPMPEKRLERISSWAKDSEWHD